MEHFNLDDGHYAADQFICAYLSKGERKLERNLNMDRGGGSGTTCICFEFLFRWVMQKGNQVLALLTGLALLEKEAKVVSEKQLSWSRSLSREMCFSPLEKSHHLAACV